MAEPTQPQMGSELYGQVSAQLGASPSAGPFGAGPAYSGGAMPGGTMGGGQLPGGLGGFNMPPLPPMGAAQQMGQSNPFGGGGSSPFGGGGIGGAGDSLKKLVDTNKDLIAAIKDLTKNIKGLGGGGPGGMPGMPGMSPGGLGRGDGFGEEGLSNRLLSNIARGQRGGGMSGRYGDQVGGFMDPFGNQNAYLQDINRFGGGAGFRAFGRAMINSPFSGPNAAMSRGGLPPSSIDLENPPTGRVDPHFYDFNQGAFDQMANSGAYGGYASALGALGPGHNGGFRPGAGAFFRSFGNAIAPSLIRPPSRPIDFNDLSRTASLAAEDIVSDLGGHGDVEIAARRRAEQMIAGNAGQIQQQADALAQGSIAARAGRVTARGASALGRIVGAGGTNMSQIVSQIPYLGGIMAAPLNVLEGRLAGAIPGELPGIIQSGYGLGGAQGSGHINTHSAFINRMTENLGLGATEALNMGNQVLNLSSGQIRSGNILANRITAAIANGVNVGDVGVNAAMGAAGSNLKGTGFAGTGAIRMALGMGLRGQGVSDFLGAVSGLGGQFNAMGIDLDGNQSLRQDISDIHRSGFGSLRGKGAVEGYSRMRQKGGIAAAQSLGGMFGGVAQELLMASALDEAGGNFSEAGRILENLSPYENRQRLAQMLGVGEDDEVVQMMMMGQGLSYAERNITRNGKGPISAGFGGGPQADAIFTKRSAQLNNERLTNTYGDNRTNLMELLRINKKIEDKLISGITINKMEDLVSLVADISNIANKLGSTLAQIVGLLAPIAQWLARLLGGGGAPTPPTPPGGGGPAPSDIRLKEDFVFIDVSEEGYNIYQFKYKDDENATVYQGVMAHEVFIKKPEAVYCDQSGYLGVYYDLIDVDFVEVK